MKIMGVDPGTVCTGFGVIEFLNNEFSYVASGIVPLSKPVSIADKLDKIYEEVFSAIQRYKPDLFSIETAFYGKNVQSAMKIGYARGVSLLAAVHNKLDIGEYSPREIKKSVVGNGAASKEQVQFMVLKLLSLSKQKMKFDESDALAAAICHAIRSNTKSNKSATWKAFINANPERIIDPGK